MVVVTRNAKPVIDLVPHQRKRLNLVAGEQFLKQRGVKEVFPFVADDFDAPLPEDLVLKP